MIICTVRKLPNDGLYRYLLNPGEEHDDSKRRVTDTFWSKNTYRLLETLKEPNNRIEVLSVKN